MAKLFLEGCEVKIKIGFNMVTCAMSLIHTVVLGLPSLLTHEVCTVTGFEPPVGAP